ncbi:SWIM-type domain-containing protein [Abeliophyllum distichum]|uniref:SWIM-type domain-containing protein n=1 Tax=Abeliophyllum distichum TaxID=126358 RepID=A0ABD1REE8_9LAMI
MAPMRITNENSVLFYLELKRKDQQLTSYSLRVEVTPLLESFPDMHVLRPSNFEDIDLQVSEGHNFVTSTSKGLSALESFASSAYESIPELDDVNSESEINVISNPNIEAITKDMIFRNKELLKKTMRLYAIENNFQYKVYKSEKYKYVLKCLIDSCMWTIRASKLGETDMFKIRYIRNGHSCSMDIIVIIDSCL